MKKCRNEKQSNDDSGRSSVVQVHGLGPVHQRNFLGANSCAPEAPIWPEMSDNESDD